MAKIPRSIEVERITWAASTLKTRELPLTVLKGLTLNLVLAVTNAASAALTRFELAKAITRISLVINGQDTRVSIPFYHVFFQNFYDFSKEPPYTIDVTEGASKVDKLCLYLPQALTRAVVPEDTLLDLRGASSCVLEVQFAAAALNAKVTVTSGYLEIQTSEYANVSKEAKFARQEMSHIQDDLSATGTKQIKLEAGGNNQYKRLFVYCFNDSAALNDSQIDNLIVRSRSFHYKDVADDILQNKNVLDYSISAQTGVYVIDFTTDGKMSQRLDARPLGELILELNSLVSNGTVEVVKEKAIYS